MIELLVAMSIFLVLSVMILYILNAMQLLYRDTIARSRISENRAVVFELIERDFKSMIVDKDINNLTAWSLADHDADDYTKARVITFVSSTDAYEVASSDVCEVSYFFHKDSNPAATLSPNVLYRQVISDSTTGGHWNYLGAVSSSWASNPTAVNCEEVIAGVGRFEIAAYGKFDSLIDPSDLLYTRPVRLEITLEQFDERLQNATASEKFRTQQSKPKVISY